MFKIPDTIGECLRAIEAIEMNPANVVGGHSTFFSGRKTMLTKQAQHKIDSLRKKIDSLSDDSDE